MAEVTDRKHVGTAHTQVKPDPTQFMMTMKKFMFLVILNASFTETDNLTSQPITF